MRIFTFLLILFFVSPIVLIGNAPDSTLMAEREHYFNKYRSVRDTMTINTWLNLKRLSDNLEQVVQRDQIIIDQYRSRISSDTIGDVQDTGQKRKMTDLELKLDQLEARTTNDMRMLWILKTAAGLMVLIILLLFYLLINQKSKFSRLKGLYAFSDKLSVEKGKEIIMLEGELDKLRQREQEFRAELEKGLITHQEKLMMLQKKNIHLEGELKNMRELSHLVQGGNMPLTDRKTEVAKLPDNEKEVKELVQSLSDERNSLMNLAGKLQKQLEEEKDRYTTLMQKIQSLSGNDSNHPQNSLS